MWPDFSRRTRGGGQADLLIFLHIPKTGGTTIGRILEREYRGRRIWSGNQRESAEALARLTVSDRASIALVKGHLSFGIHRLFPQSAVYFTLLRDPVERLVSHYYFVRRTPEHRLHRQVVERNLTLHEYVGGALDDEPPGFSNGQLRALSERAQGQPDGDRECLEEAKRNLAEYFPVAGTTERFDETLLLLQRSFGWRWPLYTSSNVGDRTARAPLDEETRELILSRNAFDQELYDFVDARLDDAIATAGADFGRAVRRLRYATAAIRPASGAVNRILGAFEHRSLGSFSDRRF